MLLSDFNYHLPEERIAKFPPKKRGASRLLVLDRQTGHIKDSFYRNLDDFLHPGDVLILNDTKVMQSRLFCNLPDGRKRELIILEKHGDEPQKVMYRGKLHPGDILTIENHNPSSNNLKTPNNREQEKLNINAQKHNNINPQVTITEILGNGIATVSATTDLNSIAKQFGTVPLPPYLHRQASNNDIIRYQTVWAKNTGSAAAPTASLNMTKPLLDSLRQKGVQIHYLTLHVGLGTFLPIRTDNIEEHKMHSEWYQIPISTQKAIISAKRQQHRVVALGTTVARTLEYYAKTSQAQGEDDIFIYPGYRFQLVDALITNFHAPKSTVLMLAAAFAGWDNLKASYQHAINHQYQFLSYGDSMLIC